MPELPEVETTRRGILPHVENKKITQVIVRERRLRFLVPADIEDKFKNRVIKQVERRGKYLLLHTTAGSMLIHLGMSGRLKVLLQAVPPQKHDHVDLVFQHGAILRFTDPRRFGAFMWALNPEQLPCIAHLGVEPLTKKFSGTYLFKQAKNKTLPIKALLMENKVVTGIGNIYAAEALFAAMIHPFTPAKNLNLNELNCLAKHIKIILRKAIKQGGTSLKDFSNSEGKPGYFSQQLQVYGRTGQACLRCAEILELKYLRQRSTVFCPGCQVRY